MRYSPPRPAARHALESVRRVVMKYLLGFDGVKNYDGSWTEWGNLVGADIETGAPVHV